MPIAHNNPFRQSRYLLSAHSFSQFPVDAGREVAFVGRSNVGKSSVINALTDQKRLAKTSKTPGRTRQINFFTVDEGSRLVDLPGYGFARVDRSVKRQWDKVINEYFSHRQSLAGLILILDIRRQITPEDEEILKWCRIAGVPAHILLNKADKLSSHKRQQALAGYKKRVSPGSGVSLQLFSALDRTGIEEAVAILSGWLPLG
jgi:GTP-binding protein